MIIKFIKRREDGRWEKEEERRKRKEGRWEWKEERGKMGELERFKK